MRLLLVLTVLLAACGEPETRPPAPSAEATPAPAEASPAPAEATPSPAELLADAKLTLPEPAPPEDPEFIFGCTTRKHRVRVAIDEGVATYEGRQATQGWEDAPELALTAPEEAVRGTAANDCSAETFTFANDGVTYEVRKGGCDRPDSPPPGPWTGKLIVKRGDTVLSQRDCGPTGGVQRQGGTITWRPGHAEAQREGQAAPIVIYSDSETKGPDGTSSKEEHTLLSVVGPYISYAVQYYAEGGAHPSYGVLWKVVDISQPGRPIDLRELFGTAAVFEALRQDETIVAALNGDEPPDLQTLLEVVDGGCTADFGPKMLERFAFHHLANDEVFVAVGAGHGCEAERGTFTIIPLRFTATDPLLTELQFANQAMSLMGTLAP